MDYSIHMEDIYGENFRPVGDATFIREAVGRFNKFVSEYGGEIEVTDVVLFIGALYIQMRESIGRDDLMSQVERILYLSEQTILMHNKEYPGRYPNSSEEAQLKFQVNDIFDQLNNDEQT